MSCFLLKTNHGRIFVSFDPGQHITPISPDNQCQPWIYLRPLETTAPLATFFNALHLTRGKVWGGGNIILLFVDHDFMNS